MVKIGAELPKLSQKYWYPFLDHPVQYYIGCLRK